MWGTERIRGELLKLGIAVSKRSIQKYMPKEMRSRSSSQTWATFLKNQAGAMWACDFTMMHDWLFRSWYIFVMLDLKTRQIVHTGVTKFPTDDWTAQQVRKATPWGRGPQYLIRDRDSKYAARFSAVAVSSGIQELKTPYRTPRANGICEGNAWITFSSKMVSMYSGLSGSIRLTTIRNDLIKGLVSRSPIIMIC